MGCHQWSHHRLKYTREQLLEFAAKELEYQQNHKSRSAYTWELAEHFAAGNEEAIYELVTEYLEREHPIQGDGHYSMSTRTGLAYISHFHNMFRIYGYPDDECHSLQEALDLLASYQRKGKPITEDENTMPALEKFWKEHPGGMITFG